MPDATTVWLFREQLQKQGLVEALFEQFASYLQQAGYQAKDGQIVDATLVPLPKQRNRQAENQQSNVGKCLRTGHSSVSFWLQRPYRH